MRRLTDEQQIVVDLREQHAVVAATPGSGKTTVLVERAHRLVSDGYDPQRLLSIVYNRDAANDFTERMRRRVGGRAPKVRTFHAIGLACYERLVKEGICPPARLLERESDVRRLMAHALRSAWPKGQGDAFDQMEDFAQFVSQVKATLDTPTAVFQRRQYAATLSPFVAAFDAFEQLRVQQGVLTYDDMLRLPIEALRDNPHAWCLFQNHLDEICVDEFQDINAVQFELLKGIAGTRAKVIAVGDDDQSIYGWRGADPSYMVNAFPKAFSPCKQLTLSWTFRYGHRVSLLANQVIRRNRNRIEKLVVSVPTNATTDIVQITNAHAALVDWLQPLTNTAAIGEVAVLARTFAHLLPTEIALARSGVPYYILGRDAPAMQGLVATLAAVIGYATGYWGHLSAEQRSAVQAALWRQPTLFLSRQQLDAIAEIQCKATSGEALVDAMDRYASTRRQQDWSAGQRLQERVDALRFVLGMDHSATSEQLWKGFVVRAKLNAVLGQSAAAAERANERREQLQAMIGAAAASPDPMDLMDLLSSLLQPAGPRPETPHVVLTTLHRSKGMEWDSVVLASVGSTDVTSDTEEERRLTYVGITRARKHLLLPCAWVGKQATSNDVRVNQGAPLPAYLQEGTIDDALAVGNAIYGGAPVTVAVREPPLFDAYLQRLGETQVTLGLKTRKAVA